jgi:glycosyltransferase involved in cell wall biosynthesis
VDDGSTDSSGILCDGWAQKDSRIKVYHKENGGLMSAWKYGVRRANGNYIGFVDSDDWIDPDMYEKMSSYAIKYDADLVCSALVACLSSGRIEYETIKLSEGLYDQGKIKHIIFPNLLTSVKSHWRIVSPNRVTKLYKKEILLSILEDCNEEVSLGEDLVTTFAFLQKAKSFYVMNGFYPYHYRINGESMIQKFSPKKYEKISILRDTLLAINDKYKVYPFETQIYTDYIDLYFGTIENEIFCSSNKGLAKSLRNSFHQKELQFALSKCDVSMLKKKYRLYLILMKWNLVEILILLRRTKQLLNSFKERKK